VSACDPEIVVGIDGNADVVGLPLVGLPMHNHDGGEPRIPTAALTVVAIPFCALVFGAFLANYLEPRIAGLPFFLTYLIFWVLITPVFLWFANRLLERR
jgi:hypothetical protein